jgi:antirestriction protein
MKSTTQNIKAIRLQFGDLTITAEVEARLEELGFTPETLIDAIEEHKSSCDGEPSVYCGTYGKYNDGSLRGLWIDLSTFDDYDEFINFCEAIHADEEDPELMFQDYEGFPREMYDECMGRDEFDNIREYIEMCEKHGQEAVDDYIDLRCDSDLSDFEEAWCGKWDDEEDFARHIVEECYDLTAMGDLEKYFDYDAFGRDLFMYDYNMGENGNVFRAI